MQRTRLSTSANLARTKVGTCKQELVAELLNDPETARDLQEAFIKHAIRKAMLIADSPRASLTPVARIGGQPVIQHKEAFKIFHRSSTEARPRNDSDWYEDSRPNPLVFLQDLKMAAIDSDNHRLESSEPRHKKSNSCGLTDFLEASHKQAALIKAKSLELVTAATLSDTVSQALESLAKKVHQICDGSNKVRVTFIKNCIESLDLKLKSELLTLVDSIGKTAFRDAALDDTSYLVFDLAFVMRYFERSKLFIKELEFLRLEQEDVESCIVRQLLDDVTQAESKVGSFGRPRFTRLRQQLQ